MCEKMRFIGRHRPSENQPRPMQIGMHGKSAGTPLAGMHGILYDAVKNFIAGSEEVQIVVLDRLLSAERPADCPLL